MVINWSLFFLPLFFLPLFFLTINATSLLDYPVEAPNGHLIFHSVLTDVSTSEQWQITELMAGISQVHGKIQVTMADTHKFEIFYHSDRDDQRILLNDDSCSLVSYDFKSWSTLLPGVEKSLVNMILMLGPSLIYRFDTFAFDWIQEKEIGEEEEEVRGVQVISYSTNIGTTLKIIVYFKSDLDLEEGIRNPLRMIFEESKSGSSIRADKIILDIYSLKFTQVKLDQYVEVTPGFGCNIYFQTNKPFPKISGSQVHLVISESYNKNAPSNHVDRIEIFADIPMNYLRVNKGSYGSPGEETLYDTDLGVGFTFDRDDGSCRLVPLTTNVPGINNKGLFSLDELFLVQGSIKYVGNIYLPNEWPFAVDYWESTSYNVQIDNEHLDKVVTTYYFSTTTNSKLGHIEHKSHTIPTSVIRKGTRKMRQSIYNSIQRRDIHEFQASVSDDQYKGAFQIDSCANDWNQKKSLTLLIDSDSNGLKFAEKNVHQFRESLRKLITNEISVSPLRIVDLDILFSDNRVKAIFGFIETPKLEDSLASADLPIDTGVLTHNSHAYQLENAEECLKFLAPNTELRSAVYCYSNSLCIGIKDTNLLLKAVSQGTTNICKAFMIPFGNLNHLKKQIALEDIDQALKSKIVDLTIGLTDNSKVNHEYKMKEIVDITMDSKSIHDRQAFTVIKEGAKLNVNQPVGLIKSVDVTNYGSCYRSCEQSAQLDCSVFSYCFNDTTYKYECLVSSGLNVTGTDEDGDKIILDTDCTVNKRNLLFNYIKLPSKMVTDLPIATGHPSSIEDCAVKCSQSADCNSFQYCNLDSICYLSDKSNHNNQQHNQQANSSLSCDFYLLKADKYFQLTGTNLVTNLIHTVKDSSLDQCAASCYSWRSSESSECRSFNFCAQGQTNWCELSGTTVNDKDVQLTDSLNCINYEILSTARGNRGQLNVQKKVSGSSGGSIATIIVFIMIGLAAGLGSPFAYKKIKQKYSDGELPMQRLS